MTQGKWEADKMLDVYIYDYLMKRDLQASAKTFMSEGKVSTDPVAIDAPGGFLLEWWSVFWDIFITRTNEQHSPAAAAYTQFQHMKAREQKQLQMQHLQLVQQQQQAQLLRRDANNPSLNGALNAVNPEALLGPSPASLLAAKMYQESMKHPHSFDSEASSQVLDTNRISLLNSATNRQGQLIQHNPGSIPANLQHFQGRNQQTTDIKSDFGGAARSLPIDSSSGQSILQGKAGVGGVGLSQGVSGLPLKGWPLTGIGPSLGPQMQKPLVSNQNQFQLLSPIQQQQFLAQAQAQNNFGNLPVHGDIDTRRLRPSSRSSLSGKEGQLNANDASINSPMQSASAKLSQMQQFQNQQPQEQLQQQHSQQNSRKRKTSSSGAVNSTGIVHTNGPVNSPPSTHMPGDGSQMASNKGLMICGTEGNGGLVSSTNQMDTFENYGDIGSLDDNVESFLSNDDGDGRDIFASLKRSPDQNTDSLMDILNEICCIRSTNNKVGCCHFSSDGKLLASAGHERKVVIWNMDTLQTESSIQGHSLIITDVRFRLNSTQLATSSFDRTVRLWDAAQSLKPLYTFTGHSSQVKSVDFHPIKTDVFCSSDGNGEIRYWSINRPSSSHVSKGGTVQVRIQPRNGQFLAAAEEKMVSIIDFETDTRTSSLQGHDKEILSICWDATGERLASVSQDCVKVWSLKSWECIHKLRSGNRFHSCIFHPRHPQLLVIGGYESLDLWNVLENRPTTFKAHDGLIAALAESPSTAMIASASHDKSVKIWK